MPDKDDAMDLEDLIDAADVDLLRAEAAKRGMTLAEMAKHGIQQKLTDRTRPKAMKGTVVVFRRKE
jgi:hypothetical protein